MVNETEMRGIFRELSPQNRANLTIHARQYEKKIKFLTIITVISVIGFAFTACPTPGAGKPPPIPVTFTDLTANGSETQTSTQLNLTFSDAIIGLTADDITLNDVSGITKGTLSGSGPSYTLGIGGFTANGTLSVTVAKSGYNISGSPKAITIYYTPPDTSPINVTFSVTADGSATKTTTQLTLTFSQAVTGLTANDITLSGVSGLSKGSLGGSGKTYTLGISGFSAGGSLSVVVASPAGYIVNGSPRNVTIYFATVINLNSVTANGSSTQTSTQLTLTFDKAITGLIAGDITLSGVSGVTNGTLSGSGTTYTLGISGFTTSGNLSVAVASPAGYNISGSPQTVGINYVAPTGSANVTVTFAQIADIPDIDGPTIKLTGSPASAVVSLDNPGQYSNIKWYITGTDVTQTGGASFTLTTIESVYNNAGQHFLNIEVTKGGRPYNKTIIFTVDPGE